MADDARLHQILDLVEQARKEGDTATEQKAIAAYKAESAPATYVNKLDTPLKFLKAAGEQALRLGSLADKGATDAIVDTAVTPINATLAIKNKLTGSETPAVGGDLHLPVAEATNPVERAVELAGGFAAGSKIPIPGMPAAAAQTPRALTNSIAREAGYVLPPSEIQNAGGLARTLGKVAGVKPTEAAAALRNKAQTADNLATEFGLPPGTPLSAEALDAVASHAWESGYKPIEELGPQYASLVDVLRKARETSRKLFTDYSRTGRSESLDAAKAAQTTANNAENVLQGAVTKAGRPDLMPGYLAARTTIAKAANADRALKDSTGVINEAALATSYGKDAPLTGALLAAGRTAQAAPKSFSVTPAATMLDTGTKLAGLGSAAGIVGSQLAHNPHYAELGLSLLGGKLGVSGLRAAMRAGLLSPAAQDAMQLLTPKQKNMAIYSALLRGGAASNGSNEEDQQ